MGYFSLEYSRGKFAGKISLIAGKNCGENLWWKFAGKIRGENSLGKFAGVICGDYSRGKFAGKVRGENLTVFGLQEQLGPRHPTL
jgi:hypothetical protein